MREDDKGREVENIFLSERDEGPVTGGLRGVVAVRFVLREARASRVTKWHIRNREF